MMAVWVSETQDRKTSHKTIPKVSPGQKSQDTSSALHLTIRLDQLPEQHQS